MYKTLLNRMVEEELERRAASRARVTVSAQEIDDALVRLAKQNKLTLEQLLKEAIDSGLTIREYRMEIRRQLLEAKLLNLRVAGRIRITPEDLRAAYQRYVMTERRKLKFRGAWIRIRAPRDAPRRARLAARKRVRKVLRLARKGRDFSQLARRYSDDPTSKRFGGLLPPQTPKRLPRALRRAAISLDVGEVSGVIRDGEDLVVSR